MINSTVFKAGTNLGTGDTAGNKIGEKITLVLLEHISYWERQIKWFSVCSTPADDKCYGEKAENGTRKQGHGAAGKCSPQRRGREGLAVRAHWSQSWRSQANIGGKAVQVDRTAVQAMCEEQAPGALEKGSWAGLQLCSKAVG